MNSRYHAASAAAHRLTVGGENGAARGKGTPRAAGQPANEALTLASPPRAAAVRGERELRSVGRRGRGDDGRA